MDRHMKPLTVPGEKLILEIVDVKNTNDTNLCFSLLWKLMHESTDKEQVVGYYLSYLGLAFPKLKYYIRKGLTYGGYKVKDIWFPSDATFQDDSIYDDMYYMIHKEVLVSFGLMLLVAFKDESVQKFELYSTAMSKILGVSPHKVTLGLSLVAKGTFIRNKMICVVPIKRRIIELLLSPAMKEEGEFSKIASYVTSVLKWTDMTAYLSILEAIFKPGSPILKHPDIWHEASQFCEAMEVVASSTHPEFLGFLGSEKDQALLDQRRYPILFSVAIEILNKKVPSLNLVCNQGIKKQFIEYLVQLHENSTSTKYEPKRIDLQPSSSKAIRKVVDVQDTGLKTLINIDKATKGKKRARQG